MANPVESKSTMAVRSLASVDLSSQLSGANQQPRVPISTPIITSKKWEQLKPLIRTLYIDENKTFPRIESILKAREGFAPTKSQFDKRVKKWGFKKNASRVERRRIILSDGAQSTIGSNGRVVNQAILERWKKRLDLGIKAAEEVPGEQSVYEIINIIIKDPKFY